ncbi:MAG: hypothetical protein INR64_18360, partial [Caulobacteraceae bacterium]|nr:hypothetical protein [Caulobacter sp.]
MDIASFEDLVDRHGGDPARWPAPERGEAQALLAVSAAARTVLAATREVESVLRTPVAAASSGAID